LQSAAIPLLDFEYTKKDVIALQKHFRLKRDRFKKMGDWLTVDWEPQATFYIWTNLAKLPEPINNGLVFFEECLKERVIVVPGIFFDVNPGKRRELMNSPCKNYIRLSFGPDMTQIERGLDAIERVIKKYVKC
jgi:aspartate/methionine/tyrosine aminotransferase